MRLQTFFHQHYSPQLGESPWGHAIAVLVGLTLMTVGVGLIVSIALIPVGTVIAILGVFVLGGGMFAHIKSPVKFADFADTVIGLAGAAIGITFALVIAAFVAGFTVTVLVNLVWWLVG